MYKKYFLIVLLFFVVSCRTTQLQEKERLTIKEKIVDNSFDISGIARQDTIKKELFLWDTILYRYNKTDTLRTIFNEADKRQSVKLVASCDTLRDTIYVKEKAVYIDVIKEKAVAPKWAYWCLLVAFAELVIIATYFYIKLKKL